MEYSGGYCGYVNFGSAGFFALGAYSSVCLYTIGQSLENSFRNHWLADATDISAAVASSHYRCGILSQGWWARHRLSDAAATGCFFCYRHACAAVVLQTFNVNWSFVGGSRGAYVIPPNEIPFFGPYIQYLFVLMLVLVIISLTCARLIERSRLGYGFATIRDDELAAEAWGVPTLRLKLIATVLSGALMGMAGAPFPFYIGYNRARLGLRSVLRGQLDRNAHDRWYCHGPDL